MVVCLEEEKRLLYYSVKGCARVKFSACKNHGQLTQQCNKETKMNAPARVYLSAIQR